MKKFLIIITCFLVLFSLTGCNSNKENNNLQKEDEFMKDKNSLVLYFSATGTTKIVAENIKEVTNSDIIEIIPNEKYTDEDLDYNNDCRANKEQNDESIRPEIKNDINIDDYDIIYLGYPIWWGTNPKIILTLLDNLNFDNKNVALFCTSGSSGIENSVSDLKAYNNKVNWLGAKRFTKSTSKEEIKNWINSL